MTQLEKIINYIQEDVMVFCKIGNLRCYLYKEDDVTYIIGEQVLAKSKITELDSKVISQVYKSLFE